MMSKALESLFAACEELEASDVHVMAGRKPCFRVRGALAPNGEFRELDAAETETLALELGRLTMPPGTEGGDARVRAELLRLGSLDGAATSRARCPQRAGRRLGDKPPYHVGCICSAM